MNKFIGILILILYFGNYHLSLLIANGDNDFYWDVNKAIYSIIIILSIKYKYDNSLLSKLFISIIVNNIYLLLFCKEMSYDVQDIYFILIFTILQKIKADASINRRILIILGFRTLDSDFDKQK